MAIEVIIARDYEVENFFTTSLKDTYNGSKGFHVHWGSSYY